MENNKTFLRFKNLKVTLFNGLLILLSILFIETINAQSDSILKSQLIPYLPDSLLNVQLDKVAEFPGGYNNLFKFWIDNYKLPQTDNLEDLEFKIYVRFLVDTCGKISDVKILRQIYPDRLTDMENEVVKTFEKMPAWIPAEKNGKKMNSWLIIPIKIDWQ